MNAFGYLSCFIAGLIVGVVIGFLIPLYFLHLSHRAFIEGVTKSPKGK